MGAVDTGRVTYPSSTLAVCDLGSIKENRIDAVLASVLMMGAFIVSGKVNIRSVQWNWSELFLQVISTSVMFFLGTTWLYWPSSVEVKPNPIVLKGSIQQTSPIRRCNMTVRLLAVFTYLHFENLKKLVFLVPPMFPHLPQKYYIMFVKTCQTCPSWWESPFWK